MSWYTAHVVIYVRFKDGIQDSFPVWENVLLIEAQSFEGAAVEARALGQDEEGDCEGSFRWGNRPAEWVFGGVRRIVACVDPESRPSHGTEVTYLELELVNRERLDKYLNGEQVEVIVEAEENNRDDPGLS